MPLSATAIGALLGLGTQMYSNALRKLPYMRRNSLFLFSLSLSVCFLGIRFPILFFLLLLLLLRCRSMGARVRNGVGRCFCEPASQMGGSG